MSFDLSILFSMRTIMTSETPEDGKWRAFKACMEATSPTIEPIVESVSGRQISLHVRLEGDATDQQIICALDDVCRAWSANITTGAALQLLVGNLLMAVQARGIHKQEPWGTFDAFVTKEIATKYGIELRTAYRCLELVSGLPHLTPEQTRIPTGKLLLAAKAVNAAPPQSKERVRMRVMERAGHEDVSIESFRAELKGAKLLRTSHRESHLKLVTLNFQVPVELAERWKRIVGNRPASLVFAEMVEAWGSRKGPARVHSAAEEHRVTA